MLNKEFFKGMNPNTQNKIAKLTAETDAITAKIDAEETKKEKKATDVFCYEVTEQVTRIKEFNASDLPLFFSSPRFSTAKVLFKVAVKEGKLQVQQLLTWNDTLKTSFTSAKVDEAFESVNTQVTQEDWNAQLEYLFKTISDE
jgi:hypothetical protein